MNQAATNIVERKELRRVMQSKRKNCRGRKEEEQGNYTRPKKKKAWLVMARLLSLEGIAVFYQADGLTSVDQEIPDWLV